MENTFHKIIVMPDVKGKTLRDALETEVIKSTGPGYQFREQDLGEVPGPGNKVNRKMVTAGMKIDALEQLSRMFAASRTKANLYTTYPMALQVLLDKLGILADGPLGFVDFDQPTSRIVIFKGKEVRVTREVDVAEPDKDPDRSTLAMDIYRTLLFYNETYPEERVNKLVLAGSSGNPQTVDKLKEKTAAEIIPLAPEELFPGIEETSHPHPGCLGLALVNPDDFDFGFVPFSVVEKRKTRRTLGLSSSVSLGVLLICALAISRYSFDLRDLNVYHGGIKGKIKMKEDRLRDLTLEFVSQSIETSQPPWSEILMELAAVVPQGVALKTLTLKKVRNVWQGNVTGIAHGSDEINSLLMVEELQSNFVQSPLFTNAKLAKRELQAKSVAFEITYQLNR